ncbi:AAA family ATPase [Exiguobacterium sp. MER 193]|uniref:AAA family ATPase n=1 Tax=Exiguobacterium sp. MER 193 TaxID=2939564 RepID=UPI00203A8D6B|nr:AAA family ATPase [Exiguobacterium sp. MER 193]MCM3281390.1 AAA family ATPase [Exiguobacterium sp. MER 193]
MIKLKKISINGFKSFNRNLELSFSEEMISVIYGENGNGKTTFLKIIHALLSKDEKILYNEKVQAVTIWYKDGLNDHKVKVTLIKEDENYLTLDLAKRKRKRNLHRNSVFCNTNVHNNATKSTELCQLGFSVSTTHA